MAVVVHSYRHRYALVQGDPGLTPIESRLAAQPVITVPTIAIDGDGDGVSVPGISEKSRVRFGGPYEPRTIPLVGHNLPQEAPEAFANAVQELAGLST